MKENDKNSFMVHNPEIIVTDLSAKLASRSRHVCCFFGAGTSKSAGLPDLAGLQEYVISNVSDPVKKHIKNLFEGRNLEEGLSRLRKVASLLVGDEKFEDIDLKKAKQLDREVCNAIIQAVDLEKADVEPFIRLASWASRGDYLSPIEIFTINYDLLIETGLEQVGALYFDGFVGHIRARFRSDLIEPLDIDDKLRLPAKFTRVWKLHGSTNWAFEEISDNREIVRLGRPPEDKNTAAIYPSEQKYDDSRRVPFVVLMDRFRRALAEPETLTIVSGYSYGDQHLNELMFEAAIRHPRSEIVVFSYGEIPKILEKEASRTKNIIVFSENMAIVGGQKLPWSEGNTIPGIFENNKFLLGDFCNLTSFLSGFKEEQTNE